VLWRRAAQRGRHQELVVLLRPAQQHLRPLMAAATLMVLPIVVLFALAAGSYTYLTTRHPVEPNTSFGAHVQIDPAGYARIDATFVRPGAAIVLFGT
jgi:hypothetical protein